MWAARIGVEGVVVGRDHLLVGSAVPVGQAFHVAHGVEKNLGTDGHCRGYIS